MEVVQNRIHWRATFNMTGVHTPDSADAGLAYQTS